MKKYLMPLGIAALLLSGCASEDAGATDSSATPEVTASQSATASTSATGDGSIEGSGVGSYTFESDSGAMGTLEVPGSAPTDIEELRAMIGGEPVAYLTGNLDNRNGSEAFDVYMVSVYDAEGNKYDYEPAQDYMHGAVSIDAPGEIYDKYSALYDTYGTLVEAMERKDFVMVGPPLPEQIAGVSVSDGFGEYGAQPAG